MLPFVSRWSPLRSLVFSFDPELAPFATVLVSLLCGWHQVLATASAVSRANMTTSDWLRPFEFDKVFWSTPDQSTPNEPNRGDGEDGSANVFSTQQSVFEGLGERIVEDVLNVSAQCPRGVVYLDEGVVRYVSALMPERGSSHRTLLRFWGVSVSGCLCCGMMRLFCC